MELRSGSGAAIAQLVLVVVTSVVSTRVGRNDAGVCGTLATVVGVYSLDRGVGCSLNAKPKGWTLAARES